MNIDVEAFGLYLAVIVAGALLLWSVWPVMWTKKKKEELTLDPVPAPVAEIKPAPVASLEPVVAPVVDKAQEEVKVNIDAKTEEAFVKAMETEAKVEAPVATPKVKKPAAKKEKTFVPAAAPKPKVPAKKVPAKKVTKK
jgi:hypothetical protein